MSVIPTKACRYSIWSQDARAFGPYYLRPADGRIERTGS